MLPAHNFHDFPQWQPELAIKGLDQFFVCLPIIPICPSAPMRWGPSRHREMLCALRAPESWGACGYREMACAFRAPGRWGACDRHKMACALQVLLIAQKQRRPGTQTDTSRQ